MFRIPVFVIILLLVISCNNKNEIPKAERIPSETLSGQKTEQSDPGRYADDRDSLLRNYVDTRKPHLDSIDRWNEDVIKEKENSKSEIGGDTKQFTIDPATGEVVGCALIKFNGVPDYKQQSKERDLLKEKFEQAKTNIKPFIMKGKNEIWYDESENKELSEVQKSERMEIGPVGYLYNKDETRLIVPVGSPHGGEMSEVYFFNEEGGFLAKNELDKKLSNPSCHFNAAETHVIVSNAVSGDFYFFTLDGDLVRKGSFNDLTGDRGTSYGRAHISKSGKYWMLQNNLAYVYHSDSLVTKVDGHNLFIDEESDRLFYLNGRSKIMVQNLLDNTTEYMLSQQNIRVLNITGNVIYVQSLVNNKIYNYEII